MFHHFVLESAQDLFEIFPQNDLLLEAVTMAIVDVLSLIIYIKGEIDVICKNIFSFDDVHASKFWNVAFQVSYRLRSIFLFEYVAYFFTFLLEHTLQSVEVPVSHFFENVIVIC